MVHQVLHDREQENTLEHLGNPVVSHVVHTSSIPAPPDGGSENAKKLYINTELRLRES